MKTDDFLIDILIRVIEKTDGRVIVVVFVTYIAFRIYRTHKIGEFQNNTLKMVDNMIKTLLGNIDTSIKELNTSVKDLVRGIEGERKP